MGGRALAVVCVLACAPSVAAAQVELRLGEGGRKAIVGKGDPRQAAPARPRQPDLYLESLVNLHCDSHDLEPKLVRALIQVESAWNPAAVSRAGAMGLMQLMPETATLMRVADPYDPEENVRAGTAFLRRMIDRFDGQLELALAAYNAGPGAVERYGGVPPYAETRDYVRRVLRLYGGDGRVPALSPPGTPARKAVLVRTASGRPLLTTSLAPR